MPRKPLAMFHLPKIKQENDPVGGHQAETYWCLEQLRQELPRPFFFFQIPLDGLLLLLIAVS